MRRSSTTRLFRENNHGQCFRRPVLGLIAGLVIVSLPAPLLADPGFGTVRKKKIDLKMRRPALVRLANTTVAFKGNATDPQYRAALNSLAATLETELVSNEKTLIKQPEGSAEWTVALTITGFQVPPPTTRTTTYGNSSTTFQRWTGTMNVAYQVVDRSGHVHDADNVSVMYDKEINANAAAASGNSLRIPGVGGGAKPNTDPRTQEDVKQLLIQQVVVQIGSNLGNTVQLVDAQVAGGESALDRAGDFMVQQLWARAVEELEKKSAFVKPEDESYRQYNLGLAYRSNVVRRQDDQRAAGESVQGPGVLRQGHRVEPEAALFRGSRRPHEGLDPRYRSLEAMSREIGRSRRRHRRPRAASRRPPPHQARPRRRRWRHGKH